MGSVETLIVWENLDCNRIVLKNHSTGGMLPFIVYGCKCRVLACVLF